MNICVELSRRLQLDDSGIGHCCRSEIVNKLRTVVDVVLDKLGFQCSQKAISLMDILTEQRATATVTCFEWATTAC